MRASLSKDAVGVNRMRVNPAFLRGHLERRQGWQLEPARATLPTRAPAEIRV